MSGKEVTSPIIIYIDIAGGHYFMERNRIAALKSWNSYSMQALTAVRV